MHREHTESWNKHKYSIWVMKQIHMDSLNKYICPAQTKTCVQPKQIHMSSPNPRRWDSKCSSKCESKSWIVKVHISFQMSRSKRVLWWPSRGLYRILMTISSLIFSGTGCSICNKHYVVLVGVYVRCIRHRYTEYIHYLSHQTNTYIVFVTNTM